MNIFASIVEAIEYEKVTFYTIKYEEDEHSEFEKFILAHQNDKSVHNEYNDIMSLLKRMGTELGAKARYFSRHEQKAEALPPIMGRLRPDERKLHVKYQKNLRLYCMRMSDQVVFLFNGGIKSDGQISAQECDQVRRHFANANKLATIIEQAMMEKEIQLVGIKLEINTGYELIL